VPENSVEDLKLDTCINIKQSNIHPGFIKKPANRMESVHELKPLCPRSPKGSKLKKTAQKLLSLQIEPAIVDWPNLNTRKCEKHSKEELDPYRREKGSLQIRIYVDFLQAVRASNFLAADCLKGTPTVCILSKNNGELIRSIVKTRYWMTIKPEYSDEVNFVWSSKKVYLPASDWMPSAVTEEGVRVLEQYAKLNPNIARILTTKTSLSCLNKPPPFFHERADFPKRQF
jgi:hypothetical protein